MILKIADLDGDPREGPFAPDRILAVVNASLDNSARGIFLRIITGRYPRRPTARGWRAAGDRQAALGDTAS